MTSPAVASRRRSSTARRAAATLAGVASLLLAACTFGPPPPNQEGEPPNLPTPTASPSFSAGSTPGTADAVARKLAAPWGLAFLQDGSALVTERKSGRILRLGPPVTAAGVTVTVVGTVAGVNSAGDGGLLGIATSPRFATDGTVFLYYSTAQDNRIATLHLTFPAAPTSPAPSSPATPSTPGSRTPDPTTPSPSTPAPSAPAHGTPAPSNPAPPTGPSGPAAPTPPATPGPTLTPTPILTGIPHSTSDNGGWLAFGPDGSLYASTGAAGHPASSQDKKSLAGKILRMTAAGRAATGNPFPSSLVYAYGFRDVEGFAWDVAGYLYATDNGRPGNDTLDNVAKGGNYGYPTATTSNNDGTAPGVTVPLLTWPLSTSGCAGVASVDNLIATTCLTGKRMWLVQVTSRGGTFGAPVDLLDNEYGRLRAVVAAPDGSLWISTSNTDGHGTVGKDDDQIIRVVLADAGAGKT